MAFGTNDNTAKFALLEAKKAKRKAFEIEDTTIKDLNSTISKLNATVDRLDKSVANITNEINSIYKKIDQKVSILNDEIYRIDLILNAYGTRIGNLESKVK